MASVKSKNLEPRKRITVHFKSRYGFFYPVDGNQTIARILLNLDSVQRILDTCDMARFRACEYSCSWYRGKDNARLDIFLTESY